MNLIFGVTAVHPLSAEVRNLELEYARAVKIGDSVWIGGNVVINPGVTIGAGKIERVKRTRNLGCYVAVWIGLAVTIFALVMPSQIVRLYMKPTAEILSGAPGILRRYFTCLLFLTFNIYAAYYLQAVQRVKVSLLVSLLQSILLCTAFLYLFPVMFGPVSIWYVMLFAEIFTAIAAILLFKGADERVNRF